MTNRSIEMYNILNTIKPNYAKTKFPYNYWTPEKIFETQKIVKMISSKDKKFLISTTRAKKKRGGMTNLIYIV